MVMVNVARRDLILGGAKLIGTAALVGPASARATENTIDSMDEKKSQSIRRI